LAAAGGEETRLQVLFWRGRAADVLEISSGMQGWLRVVVFVVLVPCFL